MKQIIFTLLICCAVGLVSCHKNAYNPDIKQYDDDQIKSYITANGLTGMQKAADTTGIYYQVLTPGTGTKVDYPDLVSLVFTMRSLDGSFTAGDTIFNHTYDYLGHLNQHTYLTKGAMLGVATLLKNKGGRIRLLVPSHLAYGTSGAGSGSSTANNRVGGNQSLDYYINLINNQDTYDDLVVKNYIAANNLTGFTPTGTGLYYKVTQAGTGGAVSAGQSVEIQYTGLLLNGSLTSDLYNSSDGTGVSVDLTSDLRKGLVEGLKFGTVGAKMTLIMPSRLAYGTASPSTNIPANSCMRYDINIISVQ